MERDATAVEVPIHHGVHDNGRASRRWKSTWSKDLGENWKSQRIPYSVHKIRFVSLLSRASSYTKEDTANSWPRRSFSERKKPIRHVLSNKERRREKKSKWTEQLNQWLHRCLKTWLMNCAKQYWCAEEQNQGGSINRRVSLYKKFEKMTSETQNKIIDKVSKIIAYEMRYDPARTTRNDSRNQDRNLKFWPLKYLLWDQFFLLFSWTHVCFLHIQLMGTVVRLPKIHKILSEIDLESSRRSERSETCNRSNRQYWVAFPTWECRHWSLTW